MVATNTWAGSLTEADHNEVRKLSNTVNKNLPRRMDSATTLTSTYYQPYEWTYFYDLDGDDVKTLYRNDGGIAVLRDLLLPVLLNSNCTDKSVRRILALGIVLTHRYNLYNGVSLFEVSIKEADCKTAVVPAKNTRV